MILAFRSDISTAKSTPLSGSKILQALRRSEFDSFGRHQKSSSRRGSTCRKFPWFAILDADKRRSTTSLVQTAGRAARHLNGKVCLYADVMTHSIKEFLAISVTDGETNRLQQSSRHHPTQCAPKYREGLTYHLRDKHQGSQVMKETAGDLDVQSTLDALRGRNARGFR